MEQTNMTEKISSIKELFKNIRDTLSRNEINKIRKNIYKKENIYNFLSDKDKLTKNEDKVLNNIISYFNELHNDLLERSKYQNNVYALDLLFNEDDYYKKLIKVLLMVILHYMKVMVIKINYYQYQSIFL